MYINDVIRLVNSGYPSEYSPEEMYIWCDEVSSMLLAEDRQVYAETRLFPDRHGTVLLPEGVEFENVCYVTAGQHRLRKCDLRTLRRGGHCVLATGSQDEVRVVYAKPYVPIRLIKYRGEASFDSETGCFSIDDCEFLPGDTLRISVKSADGGETAVLESVPLMSVVYDPDNLRRYICKTADGALAPLGLRSAADCVIERVITDKTVCAAPYDSMYIDYILAKINMYQRDMNAYNHHMTAFNSRLAAYRRWLVGRLPSDEGKLVNWW